MEGARLIEKPVREAQASDKKLAQVVSLFNAKARTWNQKYQTGGALAGRVTAFEKILAERLSPNDQVLDLGCGTGAIASACSSRGFRVTACDVAEKMIDAGKRIYVQSPIEWCLLPPDWKRLPFDVCTFDAIIASSVFEYLSDVSAVLVECQRVLKPGGILIASVPDPRKLTRKLEKIARPAAILLERLPGFCRFPKLYSYAVYLKCSRNRMSLEEWLATGTRAHFAGTVDDVDRANGAPLTFLIFSKLTKLSI
jgi:ubiquinone/menaquinone biosynthesis C-methylase UbiE